MPTRSSATSSPPDTMPWPATARSTAAATGSKDQSYFLWGIDRAVVARMLTPVGEMTKAETRAFARRLGLVTADKPESVEICFVPDDDYVGVLERHLPADAPGTRAGAAGHHRRRGDRRARRVRPVHHRPAPGTARRLGRAAVRGGHPSGAPGSGHRDRRRAGGHRVHLEEVNWLAAPLEAGARVRGADPLPGRARRRPRSSGPRARRSTSAWRRRFAPFPPGSRVCSMTDEGHVLGGGVIA